MSGQGVFGELVCVAGENRLVVESEGCGSMVFLEGRTAGLCERLREPEFVCGYDLLGSKNRGWVLVECFRSDFGV